MNMHGHRLRAGIVLAAITSALLMLVPLRATAAEPIRFAIQAWPGVTVKTEVAIQLLETMGYETTLQELSPQFVYQGIRTDDVDVSLGAWMPAHKDMLRPLLDEGSAVQYAANLEGAIQGLAVPAYTWDSGIHSVEDLVEHGEQFDRRIYAIGAGAAMTRAFQDAVAEDYMGLGDWKVVPSSVAGMLSQVRRSTRKNEDIVFHGWRPHWMDIRFDIRFLEADPEGRLAGMKTTVYTIVADGWPERHPQPAKFLRQFDVPPDAQSRWIDGFGRQELPAEQVATEWIRSNLDLVGQWVEGVESADGTPAIEAIRRQFSG
ncbi:MAG: glycine betaine ABC transporter substrate-binding protein [Halofilum sp. (in: g-proteobacteria)]|nr:glycine betaine ABC transporter substrate-binding protein [Halofilum sp. (in: g-proteobacteria)]